MRKGRLFAVPSFLCAVQACAEVALDDANSLPPFGILGPHPEAPSRSEGLERRPKDAVHTPSATSFDSPASPAAQDEGGDGADANQPPTALSKRPRSSLTVSSPPL